MVRKRKPPTLPASDEHVHRARTFLLAQWEEWCREQGRRTPADLSGSCKASSLFASKVFGGRIEGNEFHQWLVLPNGCRLDLNDGAQDVECLRSGVIPDYARNYAERHGLRPPRDLYTHDACFMVSVDHKAAMRTWERRVSSWAKTFFATAMRRRSVDARLVNQGRKDQGGVDGTP